jgi:hypothetical protein
MKIYFIQFGFEEVLPIPFMKRVKKIIDDEDMENMIIGSSLIGDYSIMCAKQHKIDKISLKGIDSLTEIDKEALKI